MNKPLGIYFHIPFCRRKSRYCDFYSVETAHDNVKNAYVNALLRRLREYPAALEADTIYFGGGTPSMLTPEQIHPLIRGCKEHFNVAADAEITMEINPATADAGALTGYLESGVTRLSVGVQSLCDDELRELGRLHTAEEAREFVRLAHAVGFREISCDIMLGTPLQTRESAARTLNELCELPITHVSAYMLKIEDNTPFAREYRRLALPEEDVLCGIYLNTVATLEAAGFMQYEISNFAKKGSECRHNLKYWRCEEYIGIGAAAHSFFEGKRYGARRDIESFIDGKDIETFDGEGGDEDELLMLGLRLREGVSANERLIKIARRFINAGFMQLSNGRLCLTPQGFLVSNEIIASLIYEYCGDNDLQTQKGF